MRLAGVEQVRAGLLAALNGKNLHATARKLAALSGYFTGPDVYYKQLYYTQAQNVMKNDGVSNVSVPARAATSRPATSSRRAPCSAALATVSSSTKLTGLHGVGLDGVCHQEQRQDGDAARRAAPTTSRPSVGMVVRRHGQEHGRLAETNVPVKVT